MQLNNAPLVMENAQHQQFTPQQESPIQTQLSVPPPAADKGASANSGKQQLSYAEVVTQGQTDPVTTETSEQRTQRGPETRVQGVDPFKEGRCLRCLARGTVATQLSVVFAVRMDTVKLPALHRGLNGPAC